MPTAKKTSKKPVTKTTKKPAAAKKPAPAKKAARKPAAKKAPKAPASALGGVPESFNDGLDFVDPPSTGSRGGCC